MNGTPERNPWIEARRCALLALAVVTLEKVTSFFLFLAGRSADVQPDWALNLHSVLFYWLLPIAVVYWVEHRGLGELGLDVPKDRMNRYAGYAFLSLVLPWVILGGGLSQIAEVLEQIAFIAVPEELVWRGYLQYRMVTWLGWVKGLALTACLFGLGHLVTILGKIGSLRFPQDLFLVLQTTAGGLILGAIFIRAKNIVPGLLFHIFGNVYLFKIIERFA